MEHYANIVRMIAYHLVIVGLAVSWLTDTPLGKWVRLELAAFFISLVTLLVMERFIVGELVEGIPRYISTGLLVVLALHLMAAQGPGVRLLLRWLRDGLWSL